jgi:transcriptional regulator with XRE-family HTH domain
VDGAELGRRLRARRAAAGRTIASVALDAGLSAPLLATLENGRANPTFGALRSLARALGARLDVRLVGPDPPAPAGAPQAIEVPEAVARFAKTDRFQREVDRLARGAGAEPDVVRERLLAALAAGAAVCGRPLDDLDCHRLLDAIVLIGLSTSR